MNEIWTFDIYPNPEEIPECLMMIDQSTDPPTVTIPPMPDPATISGEDWRRLLDLCFARADRFSLHRCGYPGARPSALEEALGPFLAGEYRSYACLHAEGQQFWEPCLLYRAEPEAKEIVLRHITHLFDREGEESPFQLPEKYRAYEQEREAAEKRLDAFMERSGDDLTMEEADAFDKENFRESRRLWKEVFDPADFVSHMEDLCFFRGREEFFETVTHESLCFVRVQDSESAQELRAMGAWADETENFHGALFSLDRAEDLVEFE